MKHKHLLIPFISLALLAGCTKRPSADNLIVVDTKVAQDPVSIHSLDVITDVEIISLAHDSILVARVDKVIRHDNLFYLLDGKSHAVHIYSVEGAHIKTISRRGNGRGEYQMVSDIFIDSAGGTLNILSADDRKLLVFDLLGSEQPQTKMLPKHYEKMIKLPEGYLAYKENNVFDEEHPYNIWLLDNDLRVVEGYLEMDPVCENSSYRAAYPFSLYGERLYCLTNKSYLIHQFTQEGMKAEYEYDFGTSNLPEVTREMWRDVEWMFGEGSNYVRTLLRFQETAHHLLAYGELGMDFLLFVHDKARQRTEVAKLDIYEGKYYLFFSNILGMDEQAIYSTIEAAELYLLWSAKDEYQVLEERYPQQTANLRARFSEVDKEGNPFLIICSIR